MADNTILLPGGGGDTIATDDIGGVKYPRSKVVWGVDGAANDASASAPLPVVQTGTPVLPTGAATGAKQDTGNTSLGSIDTKLVAAQTLDYDTGAGSVSQEIVGIALPASGGPVAGGTATNPVRVDPTGTTAQPVTDNGGSLTVDAPVGTPAFVRLSDGSAAIATLPVSAAALPLPSGASTETTLGARLSESDFDTKAGSLTETAPATDTASSGLNGRLQRVAQRLTSLIALLPTSLAANGGLKVEGVAGGVAQPVSAASLPLPSGAATETTLGARLSESDFDTKAGSLTETAPATDTASSGLNGRLQRIAQRLTSMIALLPTAIGANGGFKVEGVASGVAVPVSAASLPLPTGAATEATLATLKAALTVVALQVTASGDTVLLASGTRKLRRLKMSNSHATAAVTAGIKIPSLNSGNAFDKTYLPALGGQGVWVFPAGYLQATSETISINLSGAGQVEVTAYYE